VSPAERKRFYFPAWHSCANALGWKMASGRLVADLEAQLQEFCPEPAGSVRRQVIRAAQGFARREHRAVTADDLRRACNGVVSGQRATSSGELSHQETTRAVRLFSLLRDPEDIQSVLAWSTPAEADREALIAYLTRLASNERLQAIARNAWGTTNWHRRSLDELRWLAREVRPARRHHTSSPPDPF